MAKDLIHEISRLRERDVVWQTGQCFGYVYDPGPEALGLMQQAFLEYSSVTVLDTQAFPSAKVLEDRVSSFAKQILKAPHGSGSSFTTGGTESIFLSVLAHREWARAEKGVKHPNLVLSDTAHPAFVKACFYLGVTPIIVSAGSDYRADSKSVEYHVDKDTIALVASAPAYGTGQVDPIKEMGLLAEAENIGLIIDACVGGGILPFIESPIEVSFRQPGVTAITLDWHKWFMSIKGASSVVYRDQKMLEYQTFAHSAWMGYPIVNPTITSTRSAGHLAATALILDYFGIEGYRKVAIEILEASETVKRFLRASNELELVGDPPLNVFSFKSRSPNINVYRLQARLREKGWFVQPQTSFGDMPESCHISVSRGNIPRIEDFLGVLESTLTEDLGGPLDIESINLMPIKKRDAYLKRQRVG